MDPATQALLDQSFQYADRYAGVVTSAPVPTRKGIQEWIIAQTSPDSEARQTYQKLFEATVPINIPELHVRARQAREGIRNQNPISNLPSIREALEEIAEQQNLILDSTLRVVKAHSGLHPHQTPAGIRNYIETTLRIPDSETRQIYLQMFAALSGEKIPPQTEEAPLQRRIIGTVGRKDVLLSILAQQRQKARNITDRQILDILEDIKIRERTESDSDKVLGISGGKPMIVTIQESEDTIFVISVANYISRDTEEGKRYLQIFADLRAGKIPSQTAVHTVTVAPPDVTPLPDPVVAKPYERKIIGEVGGKTIILGIAAQEHLAAKDITPQKVLDLLENVNRRESTDKRDIHKVFGTSSGTPMGAIIRESGNTILVLSVVNVRETIGEVNGKNVVLTADLIKKLQTQQDITDQKILDLMGNIQGRKPAEEGTERVFGISGGKLMSALIQESEDTILVISVGGGREIIGEVEGKSVVLTMFVQEHLAGWGITPQKVLDLLGDIKIREQTGKPDTYKVFGTSGGKPMMATVQEAKSENTTLVISIARKISEKDSKSEAGQRYLQIFADLSAGKIPSQTAVHTVKAPPPDAAPLPDTSAASNGEAAQQSTPPIVPGLWLAHILRDTIQGFTMPETSGNKGDPERFLSSKQTGILLNQTGLTEDNVFLSEEEIMSKYDIPSSKDVMQYENGAIHSLVTNIGHYASFSGKIHKLLDTRGPSASSPEDAFLFDRHKRQAVINANLNVDGAPPKSLHSFFTKAVDDIVDEWMVARGYLPEKVENEKIPQASAKNSKKRTKK